MENLPNKDSELESSEKGPAGELSVAVEQLEARAIELEKKGGDIDVSQETVERVEKKISKIKSLLKAASMALALYGTYDVGTYATSRYEITTEVGDDGELEYEHEDPETTRILNFLTGKSELAPEDRIYFYQQEVRNAHRRSLELEGQGYGIEEQKAFEEALPNDEQGLRELLGKLLKKRMSIMGTLTDETEIDKHIDQVFTTSVEVKSQYSPGFEKLIWDMQKKVGAPRIRWAAPGDNVWSSMYGSVVGPGRANYSLADNTIYITAGPYNKTLGKTLLAENAHALQFNERPVISRVRYVIDSVKTLITVVRDQKTFYQAQQEQYETPGSIEHEAHQVLEEKLLNEVIEEERKRIKGEGR